VSEAPERAPSRGAAAEPQAGELRQRYERQLALQHLQRDPAQLDALARLEGLRTRLLSDPLPHLPRWVAAFARRRAPRARAGLYLWGSVGRGKTFLMDLFYASLPPGVGRRCHFHRFMQEVHLRLAALAQQQQRNPLEAVAGDMARELSALCLDELYVADIADAMILGGLFAALLRRGVTLVATSNVAPRELYRDGLQRQRFVPAIELLEHRLEVLHIGGDTDYRLRQLTAAGTYLPAGAADSAARLAALFAQLAGGDSASSGSIDIAGRAIEVLGVAPGVVWFEFAALCGGPRSAEDYIEIAREYQSVLVSAVPVFDGAHEDEARRFIALVDELYDRNVNLVLSAAAAPQELYRGARLGALYARTASRLIEMQSAEYLAREHRP
jgi:cell division protein ZapE